jgi:hypothetical protein
MRPDLAKVICEDGRRGPRGYMGCRKGYERRLRYRNADDRDQAHADLDAMPAYESMTRRLSGGGRWFSENLGALRGLVARSRGRNWDRVYGELCRLVSPTGSNIERHVHQHLPDFIVTRTRMGEGGVECIGWRGEWRPVAEAGRGQYFVHPISRCVMRIKRRRADRPPPEQRLIVPGADPLTRYGRLSGLWYELRLEPALYLRVSSTDGLRVRLAQRDLAAELVGDVLRGREPRTWRGEPAHEHDRRRRVLVHGDDLVAIGKRSLGRRELRRLGLVNAVARA